MLAAPHPVDLGTLSGTNGFRIDGIDANDFSGISVSSAGDVNGDGFDDVIVGAVNAAAGGDTQAGESYVIFGKPSGFSAAIGLSTLNGTNGFRLDGIDAYDYSGASVSSAGDINGDGFDDLIIGALEADRGVDPNVEFSVGEAYVVFGKSGSFGAALDLSTLNGTNGFRLDGIDEADYAGVSVSSAGDVNGDGYGDLIIGADVADPAGEAYVVFGKSGGFGASLDLSTLNGTDGFRLDGVDVGDVAGGSVSSAGDVNGDGFDDVIVGAVLAEPGGDTQAGESYVVFGKSSGFGPSLDLSTLNGTNGFRLDGIDPNDYSGVSVSNAGDLNGDGFDDLIIGAVLADAGATDTKEGESYVVYGKASGFGAAIDLSTLNGTTGFRIDGVDAGDYTGGSVSGAGDVNGDGFDDLIVGADGADAGAGDTKEGETFVIFGKSGSFGASFDLGTINGTNGFRLDGIDSGDLAGVSVSGAGDVNGDGFDDLILGAYQADPATIGEAGESYVLFGGNFTGGAETKVGDATDNTLSADQGAAAVDILIGGQGGDTLVSDGGPDVLRGGEGGDTLAIPDADFSGTRRLVGGSGSDTLRLDGSGVTLDLTTIRDNRIVDIEQIDITGSGDNTLTLNLGEVLNLSSDSNTLLVYRDTGDTVNMGSGWTQQADEVIGRDRFEVFTQGAAVLKVRAGGAVDLVGVHRNRNFFLDINGNGNWDRIAGGDIVYALGTVGDTPIIGDWNGDGYDEIGVFRTVNSRFYLDYNGNGIFDGVAAGDKAPIFKASVPGTPVVGDWNGDGIDDVGLRIGNQFLLDYNGNGKWNASAGGDRVYTFGVSIDTPVIGDWNGDGKDEVGTHRGVKFFLDMNGTGKWEGTGEGNDEIREFNVDRTPITPLKGDWLGDGTDQVAVKWGAVFFFDLNNSGTWDRRSGGDEVYNFGGLSTDTPFAGNWAPLPPALLATSETTTVVPAELRREELSPSVEYAVDVLAAGPLSAEQLETLEQVDVQIANLPGPILAHAQGSTITFDVNAAGHGWFVDTTPELSEEFDQTSAGILLAADNSPAAGRMDLLTVVLHELGHVLGLDDDLSDPLSSQLMNGWLDAGVRRELSNADLDSLFSQPDLLGEL